MLNLSQSKACGASPQPVGLSCAQDVRALGEGRVLELPEEGATVAFEEQGPFDSAVGRIHYSSLITPPSSFDFDLATGTRNSSCLMTSDICWGGRSCSHIHIMTAKPRRI